MRFRLLLLVIGMILASRPDGAFAQLISPGRLAGPHADLEGIRQCTQCHALGQRGIAPAKCLDCHQTLATRIRAEKGFHATTGEACADCHKEHFGADFALIRLDTARFDHAKTGYTLEGGHRQVECAQCHTPQHITDPAVRAAATRSRSLDRTLLGLPTTCASCHEDVHRGEFSGRACSSCHTTEAWDSAPGFDHAKTRYPLTGRHQEVDCAGCHGADSVRFTPPAADRCTSCHEDEHAGAMPGRCESCHSTRGWTTVDRTALERRFEHGTTGFELVGRHASAACASCHTAARSAQLAGIRMSYARATGRQPYPKPVVEDCRSCHVDAHRGELAASPAGSDCVGCHGQEAWLPAHYDLSRHDREAAFHLEGAHRTVPCAECHRTEGDSLVLRPPSGSCLQCHAKDDPHGGQFAGRACSECHAVETFRIASFDHGTTRFALDGKHAGVPCASCHRAEPAAGDRATVRYRPLGTQCRDCHAEIG